MGSSKLSHPVPTQGKMSRIFRKSVVWKEDMNSTTAGEIQERHSVIDLAAPHSQETSVLPKLGPAIPKLAYVLTPQHQDDCV